MSLAEVDPADWKLSYSVEEACAATSLGTSKLYEHIASGRIKAKTDGRRTIILRGDLQRYLQSLPEWKPQQRQTPRRSSVPKHP